MKPTAPTRPLWPVVPLLLATTALLCWGCGQTRQILYPHRKVSPPRPAQHPQLSPNLLPSEPDLDLSPPRSTRQRPIDAPSAIDVPIFDRFGP